MMAVYTMTRRCTVVFDEWLMLNMEDKFPISD